MRNVSTKALLLFGVVFAAACGPAVLRDQHAVTFTVGGQVVYAGDNSPLGGVSVSLVGPEGTPATATTDSSGLWTVAKVKPGVYAAHYEVAGYEPVDATVDLSAFGPNQVSNPFAAVPTVQMQETLLRATISPFGVTVADGQQLTDGFGGNQMIYSVAADGDIVIAFPYRIFNGQAQLRDGVTGQQIQAVNGTSAAAAFVFRKADIDQMNGGNTPLSSDNDPYTWNRIDIQASSYSPIHGDPQQMQAQIRFNSIP